MEGMARVNGRWLGGFRFMSWAQPPLSVQPSQSPNQDFQSQQEDPCDRSHEHSCEGAGEHDRELMESQDRRMSATFVFAMVFSIWLLGFISHVQSLLRLDLEKKTAALLRVLIHALDDSAFADDPPVVPRQFGSRAIVQAMDALSDSLLALILSAFLALHNKQQLHQRRPIIRVRVPAIECERGRHQKPNGTASWCSGYMMEFPRLALQVALLLVGWAISRYLWDAYSTNTPVIPVVVPFVIVFCLFVIVAWTTPTNRPDQTPASTILRSTIPTISSPGRV